MAVCQGRLKTRVFPSDRSILRFAADLLPARWVIHAHGQRQRDGQLRGRRRGLDLKMSPRPEQPLPNARREVYGPRLAKTARASSLQRPLPA